MVRSLSISRTTQSITTTAHIGLSTRHMSHVFQSIDAAKVIVGVNIRSESFELSKTKSNAKANPSIPPLLSQALKKRK